MANIKQVKDDALAIINAALTILDKFPNLNNANVGLSLNTSTNPFTFLMDAFKSTAGYDTLIRILSNFIVYGLDVAEVAVKGVLLSNIKNLLSCSLNPFVPEDLLREGIIFDLRQLDVTDILLTCPTDPKIGRYFYFGCDEMTHVDETKNSEDFNALLWYMKNRSLKREVWKNERILNETEERPGISEKDEKKDGIITLEYNERASSIRNAEGRGMSIQTPYNNSIHVFLGNTDIVDPPSYDDVTNRDKELADLDIELENKTIEIEEIDAQIRANTEDYMMQYITEEEYNANDARLKNERSTAIQEQQEINDKIIAANSDRQTAYANYINALSTNNNFKSIEQNYYYKRTLIEFNYDYIMSLKLFDSKVVAAQLLDSLTGLLNIDLSVNYKRQLIKNETIKMVQAIVESDDTVVGDCFFTFSNEDYNAMLQKAELTRSGFFTINGEQNSAVQIDPASILDSLNGLSSGATQQEMISIIEGSLTEISGTIADTNYEISGKVNFGVRMNFIENLMTNLACVITLSVLSPKVYLLILINLKTLGRETNFNLQDFIAMFKQLIASLIRSIRDMLIQYLMEELMKILSQLATDLAARISIEQAMYYARLIKRLIDCFRKRNNTLDWTMDIVEHADIVSSDEEPKNAEC